MRPGAPGPRAMAIVQLEWQHSAVGQKDKYTKKSRKENVEWSDCPVGLFGSSGSKKHKVVFPYHNDEIAKPRERLQKTRREDSDSHA